MRLITLMSVLLLAQARFYVGLYGTEAGDPSIFIFDVDSAGKFIAKGSMDAGISPSWMVQDAAAENLYVTSELPRWPVVEGDEAVVSSFAIDSADGGLQLTSRVPTTHPNPVYATVDGTGASLVVATYGAPGSLEVFPIRGDGRLTNASQVISNQGQGTHCANFDNTNTHLLSAVATPWHGNGLDRVYQYTWNGTALAPNPAAPFAQLNPTTGPRHITFSPTLDNRVYIVDEGYVDTPCRLTVCEYHTNGTLTVVQTVSTIAPSVDQNGMYPAELAISDDGRFAYVSNRDAGEELRDDIAVFALDATSGLATRIGSTPTGGSYPRSISLDWQSKLLVVGNQKSNDVFSFAVDAATGLLTQLHSTTLPNSVAFVGLVRPQLVPTPAPTRRHHLSHPGIIVVWAIVAAAVLGVTMTGAVQWRRKAVLSSGGGAPTPSGASTPINPVNSDGHASEGDAETLHNAL